MLSSFDTHPPLPRTIPLPHGLYISEPHRIVQCALQDAQKIAIVEEGYSTSGGYQAHGVTPMSRSIDVPKTKEKGGGGGRWNVVSEKGRWWKRCEASLVCPLTSFPIQKLPYPPFKLRDHANPSVVTFVDGKILAVLLAINPGSHVLGSTLQLAQLSALEIHMTHCKLGPFRPSRDMTLASAVVSADTQEAQELAQVGLDTYRESARAELAKLRVIQSNRMLRTGSSTTTGNAQKNSKSLSEQSMPRPNDGKIRARPNRSKP